MLRGEHRGAFRRGEFAPFSGCEIAEREVADAGADESQGWMADRCGHTANLAIFSFDEFERDPAIGDVFSKANRRIAGVNGGGGFDPAHVAGQGKVAVDLETAAGEVNEGVVGGDAFDLHPVFSAMGVGRIEEAGVEAGFVAEKEQALGIGIEPAERVDVFWETEIGERAPARAGLGRELREHAVGFVKGEKHGCI